MPGLGEGVCFSPQEKPSDSLLVQQVGERREPDFLLCFSFSPSFFFLKKGLSLTPSSRSILELALQPSASFYCKARPHQVAQHALNSAWSEYTILPPQPIEELCLQTYTARHTPS